jgi:hypothetical protein
MKNLHLKLEKYIKPHLGTLLMIGAVISGIGMLVGF